MNSSKSIARKAPPRLACIACAWLVAVTFAFAQRQPGVSSRLSTGVVNLGGDVRLIVEVEGAQNASLGSLPAVEGLKFAPVGAPALEESFSLFNGRESKSRKLTWGIAIKPQRKGDFTLPPITVVADGHELQTRELALKVVEDMQGENLGLFEIDAPDQIVEGQPFTIELRFGWDSALDQALNYANLSLPWLGELPGILELDAPAATSNSSFVELSLNSRDRIRAERMSSRTVNGRNFQLLRVKKRYLATRPGKLEFPTSTFEFGQVSEGGFFNARPAQKQTYYKQFPGFDVVVQKLPEAGRPLDFSGAVGTLEAHATADRRDVTAGDSIKLSVEWTGDGNLEFFEPPDPSRMDAFKDFRVYGTTDRKSYERRVVTYDLAPISPDITAIPSVPLRVYDPAKKSYTSVTTEPIPIHVAPMKKGAGLSVEPNSSAPVFDIRDIQVHPVNARDLAAPGSKMLGALLCAVPLGWLGLRTIVRRRGDPNAPRARTRRAARRNFARELATATTASAQSRALQRFLAARSGESEQMWVGRDVVQWSREHATGAALSDDDARALAETIAKLDERTYAGRDESLDRAALLAIGDRVIRGGL